MAVVLIIDSEGEQGDVAAAAITELGFAPLFATSVKGAVERLREGGIDLAIVHYTEGVKLDVLFAQIQRLPDPPPVVLLSRRPDAPAMSARYGAVEFVATPCEAIEIIEVMQRILRARNTPQPFDDPPTRPTERWGTSPP